MGKGRFTALDVSAMTNSLKKILIGTRVANIYDLNSRCYLFKFSGKDKRLFLILESGMRFHCTSFMRELPPMPNHFASKLRKYLRSKKLSCIEQIGRDRIVMFTFGVQETHKIYLILELYAGGNIIVCDYQSNIIISLRVHGDIKYGEKYASIENKPEIKKINNKSVIEDKLRKCIARLLKEKGNKNVEKRLKLSNRQKRKQRMNQKMETIHDFISKTISASPLIIKSMMNKFKINPKESLLQYGLKPYPIIKPDKTTTSDNDESEDESDEEYEDPMYENRNEQEKIAIMRLNDDKLNILMQCFIEYERLIESLHRDECKGFIISKRISLIPMKKISVFVKKERRKQIKPTIDLVDDDDENQIETENKNEIKKEAKEAKEDIKFIYDEFIPFQVSCDVLADNTKMDPFDSFNTCVDEFYSSHEAVKSDLKQSRAEMLAFKKLETAKGQHEQRIQKLSKEADNMAFYARVIEENLEIVDKSITGVNTLLDQGINWNDLGNRIREETQFGNPIAATIISLKLHQGVITLKLAHETEIYHETKADDTDSNASDISDMFGDDEEDVDDNDTVVSYEKEARIEIKTEQLKIDVELRLSAWNNARKYYAMKKQLLDKKDKTLDATNKAIKAAEIKTKMALKEAKQTAQIEAVRKGYWFEKFYWFISSDNLLVIAGRDAQQNEIIVKKYMDKRRDIYVHALIHGASSVIIKNPQGLKQIPPRTINEAGAMCVCRSRAWNNNVATESYWVYGDQVSKTPQTGQYLPTGSFVIRGKRNFIQQQPLQMAIVLLFRIDETSYEKSHRDERRINYFRNEDEDEDKLRKNKNIGDVTQQFILDDIDDDNDREEVTVHVNSMAKKIGKRKNDENAIYITRTMIHSDPRQRKQFEEEQRQKNVKNKNKLDDERTNKDEIKDKKKMSKTDKKLAKYGFDNKDKKLSKREKNKRKKRGKYNRKYDESDRKLIQQLFGIKEEHLKNKKDENGDAEVEQKGNKVLKQDEPKEGYELNANPMNLNRNVERNKKDVLVNDVDREDDAYEKQRKFALTNRLENDLKLLTGKIYECDTMLYCMTMCAPYSCVTNKDEYEYKIKIQPGTTKRGKAVKYVSELFQKMCQSSALNEKLNLLGLCKAIKDTEINHIFLSNVKVSSAGMKSLQIEHKKKQKKMQKEKWKEKQKMFEKQQKQNKQYNPSTNPKKRKKRK